MKNKVHFKNINELAYFTAETIIHHEFKTHKSFPKDWDYEIEEKDASLIPQEDLRNEVLSDLDHYNNIVINMIERKLNWFVAEGFAVDEDMSYRFLSDQEMQAELDKIMTE